MLASRLPDGTISTDPQTLRQSATDSWPLALLRRVRGDDLPEPAAVISPATTGEVATILAWAWETGTAVIPRGAGSGVCGGAQADARRRRPRPVPDGPHRPRRPGIPDGRGAGRGARRPAGKGTGQARADHRPLPAVGRDLHRRRLDRRVVRRAGLHRVRRDRGRAARAHRGPAGRRDPALPAGPALGGRPGPEKTPHRLGGDARRRHRGDPRLPGSPRRPGSGWPSVSKTSRRWPEP